MVPLAGPSFAAEPEAEEEESGKTEASSETYYVIAGQTYEREDVWDAFRAARAGYGMDFTAGKPVPLEKLGAVRLTGTLVRRSGARMIVRTPSEGLVAILVRNGHTVAPGEPTEFTLVKRSATIQERMAGGERVSMNQYTDVTMLPGDFLKALNSGQPLKGVRLKPVQSRERRMKRGDRPESQFERRTIPVN